MASSSSTSMSSESHGFLTVTRELLELEHAEERKQTEDLLANSKHSELSELGVALLKLYTDGVSNGLYGRQYATFHRYNSEDPLPSHRFSSGDIVGVFGGDAPMHELRPLVEGVVYKVRAREVEIVFNEHGNDPSEVLFASSSGRGGGGAGAGPLHLALLASDVTMTRYKHALNDLGKAIQEEGTHRVVDLCFGSLQSQGASPPGTIIEPRSGTGPRTGGGSGTESPSSSSSSSKAGAVEPRVRPDFQDAHRLDTTFRSPVSEGLNEPQQRAVQRSLLSKDLHIIHGPPGTGKTTTCVAFILECILRDQRLLVCAPSNVAVDNLMERVAREVKGASTRLMRVGHPTRVDAQLHSLTLDARVAQSDNARLCREIDAEMKEHQLALSRARGAKAGSKAFIDFKSQFRLRGELQRLRKELKERSTAAVHEALRDTQVVFSTCAGAGEVRKRFQRLQGQRASEDAQELFDVVLVDEAAQTLEVACWIPLLCGRRAVLAGDHHQLSATVKSREAMNRGLDRTLFGRMQGVFGDEISTLLSIQYRMNSVIMGWSSGAFYDGRLEAADCVADQLLMERGCAGGGEQRGALACSENRDANGLEVEDVDVPVPSFPLVFADTVGNERCREAQSEGATLSRHNPGEVSLVVAYIAYLTKQLGFSLKTTTVCVISPYNQQVDALRKALAENEWLQDVSVNTVDSFQGREADVIILSLVRSNEACEVGFLADYRRLNVAVTRAKKHALLIGCSQTICSDDMLASLYEYCADRGKVVFASEELFDRDSDGCEFSGAPCPFGFEPASGTRCGREALLDAKGGGKTRNKIGGGGGQQQHSRGTTASSSTAPGAATMRSAAPIGPIELSPEEVDKRRVKYRGIIDRKRNEGAPYHDFPKGLNARERLIYGEGKKRFVRVIFREEEALAEDAVSEDAKIHEHKGTRDEDQSGSGSEDVTEPKVAVRDPPPTQIPATATDTPSSSSAVPPPNPSVYRSQNEQLAWLMRHEAATREKEEAEKMARHQKLEAKKAKKKQVKQPGGSGKQVPPDDDDDFDALLQEFADEAPSGKCQTCKISITHLDDEFTRCEFCRGTFCFKHIQAECHGCGDAASRKERGIHQKKVPVPLRVGEREHNRAANIRHRLDVDAISYGKLRDALNEKEKERSGGSGGPNKKKKN